MTKKNISEISNQIPGSLEFRIEVASACAESGIEYHTFAEQYDLDPDELNQWAIDYLGEGLDDTSKNEKKDPVTPENAKDEMLFDTIYHLTAVKVSTLGDNSIIDCISSELIILENPQTEQCLYFFPFGDSFSDGIQADSWADTISIFENYLGEMGILNGIESLNELLVGLFDNDMRDFEYETGLEVEIVSEQEAELTVKPNSVGLRLYSTDEFSWVMKDGSLYFMDDEVVDENSNPIFGYLHPIPPRLCFIKN
tara:strand:+ start:57 stop:818 length:762 start_codon:yes stop_codon:yes gene_type:complete